MKTKGKRSIGNVRILEIKDVEQVREHLIDIHRAVDSSEPPIDPDKPIDFQLTSLGWQMAFSSKNKELRKIRRAAINLIELTLVREHMGLELGVWIEGVHRLQRTLGKKPYCRRCGCTDKKACKSGCYWVEAALCSKCDGKPDLLRVAP